MKKRVLTLVGILVLCGCAVFSQAIIEETAPPTTRLLYGLRLQSDVALYLQGGVLFHGADFLVGLGFNNAVWLGAHKYFYSNETLSAFAGLDLHVTYPPGETVEFHPAFPLGFAITTDIATFIVQALIRPAAAGEPVTALLALSLLFGL